MRTTPVLILFVTIAFTGFARAQETEKPDRGLKGGLISARFLDAPLETESAMGFALGVFMDFRISQQLSVMAEIHYTEKGSKVLLPSVENEFDLNLAYAEVPMLLTYRPPVKGLLQPRIIAGPYGGILIGKSASVMIADGDVITPDDFVDDANDLDWGAVAGVGVDADLSIRTLTVELRYSAGLGNAFNKNVAGNYKNGVFSILFGFTL